MLKNEVKGNPGISSGHFLPPADNTYDLGSASLGWRNIYVDSLIYVTGTVMQGDFLPSTQGTYDVGSTSYPWAETYIGNTTDYLKVAISSGVVTLTAQGSSFNFIGAIETDAVTLGGTLNINGQTFSGTALFSAGINTGGVTATNNTENYFGGDFVSGGSSTSAIKQLYYGNLTGYAGDTTYITGSRFANVLITQTATESIGYITQMNVLEPSISDNLTGDITLAATARLSGAPTEGEYNTSLYIVQAGEDQDFLTFADSDVVHDITGLVPANVFGVFEKKSATEGGARLIGYTETVTGVDLTGRYMTGDTTKSTAGTAAVNIAGQKSTGSSVTSMGAGENILAVINFTTTELLVDAEGDLWLNGDILAVGGDLILGSGEGGVTLATDATIRPPNLISGAGDDNVAGADFYIKGALGRGTGDVGQIIFQTAQQAAADTIQTYETILTLDEDLLTVAKASQLDGVVTFNAPLNYGAVDTVTLDTDGDFTVTSSYMKVIPFGGAGSTNDAIVNIEGAAEGTVIILRANATEGTGNDQILITDTGNIILAGAADFAMDNVADTWMAIYDGTNWLEISRSGNA